ncbi:MAG: hypothetical protein IKP21_00490 [Bacteroidales bacterium]|nr:hypothetical protein [Bacteroidales bacterium]
MKKIFLSLVIAATVVAAACSSAPTASVAETNDGGDGTNVYICTGGSSEKYHITDTCSALASCSKAVREVTLADAQSKGRTPCKRCNKE